jgi:hypothetical protein
MCRHARSGFVLKRETQAELDLSRSTEGVNPRSDAHAIYVVSNGGSSESTVVC